MPYKDPADKEAWRRAWKKRSKQNGYNEWLYARRKVRFDDAEKFRAALHTIIEIGETRDVRVAQAALEESRKRWEALGDPPHRVRKDVKLDGLDDLDETGFAPRADTLMEAMAKLGLQ